jgi:hypothetical protein
MDRRSRLLGFLFVGTIVLQNYQAQVSHIPSAQVALWTLHDWVGALINVTIAGFIAWKAFLTNSAPSVPPPVK